MLSKGERMKQREEASLVGCAWSRDITLRETGSYLEDSEHRYGMPDRSKILKGRNLLAALWRNDYRSS